MSLDDPDLVREEYASEAGLLERRSVYENRVGPDPRDVLWDEIVAAAPERVLEVGPGPGEVSERMLSELTCDVVAVDASERMVELCRARGVDARVGDVQELPFADASFDLVVAAWVLFHVPDLDRGLAEIARVLAPGGRLVAVTNSEHHLAEAREVAGISMVGRMTFSRENGDESLRRHFARVRRTDIDGTVTFADSDAIRAYVRALVTWKHAAGDVPELDEPLEATTRNTVFVADCDVVPRIRRYPVAVERVAWTDERLGDLANRMDAGFARVDADIRELRNELRVEIGRLRAELGGEIGALRLTLLRVGGGIMIGLVGVIAAIFVSPAA